MSAHNSTKTDHQRAQEWAVSDSTVGRWRREGAPIDGTAADVLEWWRGRYRRGAAPTQLLVAAAGSAEPVPMPSDDAPVAPMSLAEACGCQRANLAFLLKLQKEAQAAQDHTAGLRWSRAIERASRALAALEKQHREELAADQRHLPRETCRQVWNEIHRNLSATLFAVAADPDRASLRQRWDSAVAQLLADPFAGSPTTPAPL